MVMPASPACAPQLRRVGEEERSAAIVQQPLGRRARLDRVVGQAVRLEMILLRVVHRNEQPLRARSRRRTSNAQTERRPTRDPAPRHGVIAISSDVHGGNGALRELELAARLRHERALRIRRGSDARDASLRPRRRPSCGDSTRAHSSSACGASGGSLRAASTMRFQSAMAAASFFRATPGAAPPSRRSIERTSGVASAAATNCAAAPALSPRASARNAFPIAGALSALSRATRPSASASSGELSVPPRSSARRLDFSIIERQPARRVARVAFGAGGGERRAGAVHVAACAPSPRRSCA